MNARAEPLPPSGLPIPEDVQALLRACRAADGHLDELRPMSPDAPYVPGTPEAASLQPGHGAADALTPEWSDFFRYLEAASPQDLDQRHDSLQRQVRDNGVTYNVYADQEGPQRPWSLDLFPLLIGAQDWRHIAAGVHQRMRLLEALMTDVYAHQSFLQRGLIPAALVHGHPGYLRCMQGVRPAGGVHLHVAAFDLARGPDGLWWLVGQRTQAPSGLGYLLENRLAVTRQFPRAFAALKVQRLATTYRALMDSLRSLSPDGPQAHIALLTPGPYNETYFEHAYLARYLGITLVEGSDLVVRDERLYLKTLQGLERVHGLLKRVDDEYMDPLELRSDSSLGVPGLLQAVRAGNLLVANMPGSAFLESPALLGFLPALAESVLGEELVLPALPTWWCGEQSVQREVLPELARHTIKPTYAGSSLHPQFNATLGPTLTPEQIALWVERIRARGEDHTLQAYMPPSQMPTWRAATSADHADGRSGSMHARSVLLRVFAVSDGLDANGAPRWRVLPGGMARVASSTEDIASMQRGGSSADVWALGDTPPDSSTLLRAGQPAPAPRRRLVTSRAAENLYWLGRYTERAENSVRLARVTLESLGGENQTSLPLLQWLQSLCVANSLIAGGKHTPPLQPPQQLEQALIDGLAADSGLCSVGFNLSAVRNSAAAVRERLSQEHWSIIERCLDDLAGSIATLGQHAETTSAATLRMLQATSEHLSAITGGQTDRMTRDDGWRLLSVGRHVERLAFLAHALEQAIACESLSAEGGFEALLALFDSTITFRTQFQQSRDLGALTELLVLDRENPRSLAWVAHTLRARLAKLAGTPMGVPSTLASLVSDPADWDFLATPTEAAPELVQPLTLSELLGSLRDAAFAVSDEISAAYFTHSGAVNQSVVG